MFLEKKFLEKIYLEKIVPRKDALEKMTESGEIDGANTKKS